MTAARVDPVPRIKILYEDRRTADRYFRLHDFMLANTRDVLRERGTAIEMYQLVQMIEKIPKGPNNAVLRALERDSEKLHAGRSAIVAWLDDDQLHRALGLPSGQKASNLIEAILKRLPASIRPDVVRIHLLRGNIEQFLRRIDLAQPGTFDAGTLAAACHKDLTARDQCFKVAAEEKHAAWRKAVREADPGFDETIRYLADLASRETWPPW
jgi:hypothetical protein